MKPDAWRVVRAAAFEGRRDRLDFPWGPLLVKSDTRV